MKSKFISALLILVLLLSVNLAGTASALELPTPDAEIEVASLDASARLVETQNADGGWEWENPDEDPEGTSPVNTLGVTAQGVLDLYRITNDDDYLDACGLTVLAIAINGQKGDEAKYRIRGPDITFLVECSEVTGESATAELAAERWEAAKVALTDNGTATEFAQYIRDGRLAQNLPAIVAWDINLYVQGLLALDRYYPGQGYYEEALEMASVIYDYLYTDEEHFDFTDDSQDEYWLTYTGALEAFATTDMHGDEALILLEVLLEVQGTDGSWEGVGSGWDSQTTAYATMALLKVQKTQEAKDGIHYLLSEQLGNGGIDGDDENTEVTSEMAQAIFDYMQATGDIDLDHGMAVETKTLTIQFAVDNAAEGDVITVPAGTYTENIKPTSGMRLVGAGSGETYLAPESGWPVALQGNTNFIDSFRIQGFTLQPPEGKYALIALSGTPDGTTYTQNLQCDDIVVDGSTGGLGFCLNAATAVEFNEVHLRNIVAEQAPGDVPGALELTGVYDLVFNGGSLEGNAVALRLQPTGPGDIGEGYGPNGEIQLHGTAIVGNVAAIENQDASVTIDATKNWWGSAEAPTAFSGNVAYDPWYADEGMSELLSDKPVQNITQETFYDTIQEAIEAAAEEDTIDIAPGMYNERVTITKPITLRGATHGVNKRGYPVPEGYAWDESVETIINNPEPVPTGTVSVVHLEDTDDVYFDGIIVQSLNAPPGSQNDMLFTIEANTKTLDNINVINSIIGPNTNTENQTGTAGRMGLYINLNQYQEIPYGLTNSSFRGTKIFGCEGNGNNVFIWGAYYSYGARYPSPMDGTVFEDFESYGSHRSGFETAGGITGLTVRDGDIYGNGNFNFEGDTDNLKYGNGMVLIRGSSDSGEQIGLGPENLTLGDDLNIYDNEKNGIYQGPVNKHIDYSGCNIHDNGWDGIRIDLEAHYKNPTFEDDDRVGFFEASEDLTARFCNFEDNGGYDVQVIGEPTNGFMFDAKNNWWGAKDRTTVETRVNGAVKYEPWTGADITKTKTKTTGSGTETVDAKNEAGTTVEKKGNGTPKITVAKYGSNPGKGFTGGTGSYVDVHADNVTDVEELVITVYYADDDIAGLQESTLKLRWWNEDTEEWVNCSDSGVNTAENYMWAKIRPDGDASPTTPTLEELTGTAFTGVGTAQSTGGGGSVGLGGGGGGMPSVYSTIFGKTSTYYINSNGKLQKDIKGTSPDGKLTFEIPRNTIALKKNGNPLSKLNVEVSASPPAAPEGTYLIGQAIDFEPDGATFEPSLPFTWSYDPAKVPEDVEMLAIGYYDTEAEEWVALESVIDEGEHEVTANVPHFTTYALLGIVPPAPPEEEAPEETQAPVTPPATTPPAETTPAVTPPSSPVKLPPATTKPVAPTKTPPATTPPAEMPDTSTSDAYIWWIIAGVGVVIIALIVILTRQRRHR